MSNSNTINIGNAGEHFTVGELERHGFTVTLPMSNVRDFDILVINRRTSEQFTIQVKTTTYKQKKWILSKKNETLKKDNFIYIFVSLNEFNTSEYHIIPNTVVAERLRREHQECGWMLQKSRDKSIMIIICEYSETRIIILGQVGLSEL